MSVYNVTIFPLYNTEEYPDEGFDATDYVATRGISKITSTVDNSDFSIGVFSFNSVTLKLLNHSGLFSNENGLSSIFPYGRDRARVDISLGEFSFTGLISEDATRENDNESVTFTILSADSILRTTVITGGTLRAGDMASQMILSILTIPRIASLITATSANISLDQDYTVTTTTSFAGKSALAVLNELLVPANSYITIDSDLNALVLSRTRVRTNANIRKTFHASHDILRREPPILLIKDYNDGQHRAFNSFVLNSRNPEQDTSFIEAYGFREVSVSAEFVESSSDLEAIETNLLDKWKVPKREFKIVVRTRDASDVSIGDIVRVNYPFVIRPFHGQDSIGKYDVTPKSEAVYSTETGVFRIHDVFGWLVYGRIDDPENFTSELHLREYGHEFGDSFIDTVSRYGVARYGSATYN